MDGNGSLVEAVVTLLVVVLVGVGWASVEARGTLAWVDEGPWPFGFGVAFESGLAVSNGTDAEDSTGYAATSRASESASETGAPDECREY